MKNSEFINILIVTNKVPSLDKRRIKLKEDALDKSKFDLVYYYNTYKNRVSDIGKLLNMLNSLIITGYDREEPNIKMFIEFVFDIYRDKTRSDFVIDAILRSILECKYHMGAPLGYYNIKYERACGHISLNDKRYDVRYDHKTRLGLFDTQSGKQEYIEIISIEKDLVTNEIKLLTCLEYGEYRDYNKSEKNKFKLIFL